MLLQRRWKWFLVLLVLLALLVLRLLVLLVLVLVLVLLFERHILLILIPFLPIIRGRLRQLPQVAVATATVLLLAAPGAPPAVVVTLLGRVIDQHIAAAASPSASVQTTSTHRQLRRHV